MFITLKTKTNTHQIKANEHFNFSLMFTMQKSFKLNIKIL